MSIKPISLANNANFQLQSSTPLNNQVQTTEPSNSPANTSKIGELSLQAEQMRAKLNSEIAQPVLVAANDRVQDNIDDLPAFKNRDAANFVRNQRQAVGNAANRYGLQPETIGAIMFQEARYYGYDDTFQDSAARSWTKFKQEGKEIEAASFYVQLVATGKGNFDANTFGKAQIRLDNLKGLISEGRLSHLISPDQFNRMDSSQQSVAALNLVLNDNNTADIIGAWAQKVKQDWIDRGGSRIINEPRGEYKLLTTIYSQYSPGSSRVNPNPNLSHNPYSENSSINKSGRDAISNYGAIWKALYTNDEITGFRTSRLDSNLRYDPSEPLRGGNGRILGE